MVHLANSPVPNAGAWWAYAPALQACWHNGWQSTTSYWIHLWDENLEDRIMHHPFQYTDGAERLVAREKYRYPLLIEVKVAECQYFRE